MLDVPQPGWTGALPYAINESKHIALLHEETHACLYCRRPVANDGKRKPCRFQQILLTLSLR
jgi:hypothetical protein